MKDDYKKNENYDQNKLKKIFDVYRIAKVMNNEELMKLQRTAIYDYIKNYVYRVMWDSYPLLMSNSKYRDDLIQDVWVKIFEEIDKYDYNKGSITTFLLPWIKHAVSEFYSSRFRNTSVYYANAITKVTGAINFCNANGIAPNIEVLSNITNIPETTVAQALDQLLKKDYVSYDVLAENSFEQPSVQMGPEAQAIANGVTEEFNKIIQKVLTEEELTCVQCLLNPDNPTKQKASYREIAAQMDCSIPYAKGLISKVTAKLRYDPELNRFFPELISMYAGDLDRSGAPILDDDDFVDEQMKELEDFIDSPEGAKL